MMLRVKEISHLLEEKSMWEIEMNDDENWIG